jgi:hypothetical protein
MNQIILFAGIGGLAFGCAELVWAVLVNAPRSFAGQSLMFAELGVTLVLIAIIPDRAIRLAVAVIGISGVVSSAILVVVISRKEQRAARNEAAEETDTPWRSRDGASRR